MRGKGSTAALWLVFFATCLVVIILVPAVWGLKIFDRLQKIWRRPKTLLEPGNLVWAGVGLVMVLLLAKLNFLPDFFSPPQSIEIIIDEGEALPRISSRLQEAGLISSRGGFKLAARLLNVDRKLFAGQYQLETGQSVFSVLERLSQGGATAINVAIPPGLTVRQIGKIYAEKVGINPSRFEMLCGDDLFIQSLGLKLNHLEGFLFPETYNFYWKASEEQVIKSMLAELMSMVKNDSLLEPTGKNQNEFYKILTLASMIEKEGLAKEELPLISAVFHNRLRINMPLQCDPTILYVLPDLNRPIRPKDLRLDSPYNTYKYYGLPPGPICNPGRNAILAAFRPAEVKYLYFVHKGDGTHVFSRSLQEHNRAIWQIRKNKTAL